MTTAETSPERTSRPGGVPPGLHVRSGDVSAVVMLAGPTREPLQYDVTWAGRNVLARGHLERQNGFSLIRVAALSLYGEPSETETNEGSGGGD